MSTWLSEDLLVMTKSSWCQCLDLGCLQDTLCCGLVEKKVLVMYSPWKEQSSSSRCPFSLSSTSDGGSPLGSLRLVVHGTYCDLHQ